MDILVAGGHGKIALRLLGLLAAQGHSARGLIRSPEHAADLRAVGAVPVLGDLEKSKQRYLSDEMEIYFDDISDAAERIWDILENYKEVIESLEATNESVLSHRLNDAIKVLNAVSVLVLPATLIASIWGMNVVLPFETGTNAFWALAAIMLMTIVITVYYFRRRGWL